MEHAEEHAVAYCENILQCVDAIEQKQREIVNDFPNEKYEKYFSLAYDQTILKNPDAVPERFALLALAGVLKIKDDQQAKALCDRFQASNADFAQLSLTDSIAQIEKNVDQERQETLRKCAVDAFTALENANRSVLRALTSEKQDVLEEVNEIVMTCISFIRKGYEARKQKFTDTKHVQYFAYFLSLLHAYGLPTHEKSTPLFEKLVKKVGAEDPARRSAMEYKYCKALVIFDEQFQNQPLEDAAICCLSYIEKGKAVLKYQKDANVQLGLKATRILQTAISRSDE